MPVYLDASVLVALVRNEPTKPILGILLAPGNHLSSVSDLAMAEASAALAARGRGVNREPDLIASDFARLDQWAGDFAETVEVVRADIRTATAFVRRQGIVLKAPDAIHIAAAHRLGATLLTLDRGMAKAAAALGIACINPVEAEAPGDPED